MEVFDKLELTPAYALTDAAIYLRLPRSTVLRWTNALHAGSASEPGTAIQAISYVELLELHVLKAMRIKHTVPLQRIRKALDYIQKAMPSPYPLLAREFSTNGLDVFFEHDGDLINASRSGQRAIREVVGVYLSRIDWQHGKSPIFFPFVSTEAADEPRLIQMQPSVAFGRPTLTGTGIAAEVIAGRFPSRESVSDLAAEYGVSVAAIEEAVRWEMPHLNAA